jgi:integrase
MVPEYFDNYYYRVRKVGLPLQLRSIDNANVTTLKAAREYALLQFKAAQMPQIEELRAAVEGTRVRRTGVTLGEFLAAFEAVAIARKLKDWQQGRNRLRLVVAVAKGIILPLSAGRLDGAGGRLIREVDAVPFAEAVCDTTAMEYARRMQLMEVAELEGDGPEQVRARYERWLAEGRPINLDKSLPPLINGTINSTLCNARVPLSRLNRVLDLAALKVDWQRAEGFCQLTLPRAAREEGVELPTAAQYKAMMAGWEALVASADAGEQELALCNEMFRLLGLRSGELVMARASWLHTGADGRVYLWVKNRAEEAFSCKSTNQAKLPLTEALALRLQARCAAARAAGVQNPFLILPMVPGATVLGEEQAERVALVRGRHNAWLKGFIGEVRSGQGNHRLRKCCATALYKSRLEATGSHEKATMVVKEYLRHSKEATALISYIRRNDERLPTMTDADLSEAWA